MEWPNGDRDLKLAQILEWLGPWVRIYNVIQIK